LGCDVYASDLNPIACMLSWGALHLVGGGDRLSSRLEAAQNAVASAVERKLIALGAEHDSEGNRAKSYLYCIETRCPQTGWVVPLLPSLVISRIKRTIARLRPDHEAKRMELDIVPDASEAEMEAAKIGTVQDRALTFQLDGETYRTPLASIRGDHRANGEAANRLRRWQKADIVPRPDDIFGERLFCIQWVTKSSLSKGRQETTWPAQPRTTFDERRKSVRSSR
jgi:putative DNA methylase